MARGAAERNAPSTARMIAAASGEHLEGLGAYFSGDGGDSGYLRSVTRRNHEQSMGSSALGVIWFADMHNRFGVSNEPYI